jgi:hypothetical protein
MLFQLPPPASGVTPHPTRLKILTCPFKNRCNNPCKASGTEKDEEEGLLNNVDVIAHHITYHT